jgi:hypothetical protein
MMVEKPFFMAGVLQRNRAPARLHLIFSCGL